MKRSKIFKNKKTYQSEKPIENEGRCGIMRSEMERRNLIVFPGVVPFFEKGSSRWIQSSYRLHKIKINRYFILIYKSNIYTYFRQVSVVGRLRKVKLGTFKVCEDPWKHGILIQVIVRSA